MTDVKEELLASLYDFEDVYGSRAMIVYSMLLLKTVIKAARTRL